MLDLAGYTTDRDLCALTIVEPSCGSGAFLVPIVERLAEAAAAGNVPLDSLGDAVWACDLHLPSVEAARLIVANVLAQHGLGEPSAAALAEKWIHHTDFLLTEDVPVADVVVGNPPYVRHDEIPRELIARYRGRWPTMRGRCDLYVPFYERALATLRTGAPMAFICADRWMRNQYGRGLRALIDESYDVRTVVRMHQVDAFEDEVDAYPAITVLRRAAQGKGLLADCDPSFTAGDVVAAQSALEDAARNGRGSSPRFEAVAIDGWFTASEWPEGSADQIERVLRWEHTLPTLEREGTDTKIGIGVATGADKIYIVKGDPPDVEPERLLPLAMARQLRGGSIDWSPTWLVNPWDEDGLVDLEDWPRLAEYLGQHHERVAGRNIAKRQPGQWHRTIDRVHVSLTKAPKVLLADMSARMNPVVDQGEYYPHHNLYWITSTEWDVDVLAGLLLSDQAEAFIRAYCVKMRGGTLRMQAQYLRKIRLPRAADLDADDRADFLTAYETRDRDLATQTAAKFYV